MADAPERSIGMAPEGMLAIYLIDLRAQYEAELRMLNDAQRQVERFRALAGPMRLQTKTALQRQLKQLLANHRAIREALQDAASQVSALPEE